VGLKKNISKLNGALAKVLTLEGISFEWGDNARRKGRTYGISAQQVEKVFPELVQEDADTGTKALNYIGLIAPLVEAIKEQQAIIESLQQRLIE